MAKKNKSLEELLEEAIVKDDVPYEVPGNWVWTTLSTLLEPMTTRKPNLEEDTFLYIDIDAIDNKNQKVNEPKLLKTIEAPSRASRELRVNDIVFSTVRPYLKNIAYISEEFSKCIASTGFYVCRCKRSVNSKYLFYVLCSERAINYFTSKMKGDNSPSIRKEEFESLLIQVPPLKEQERIVERVESLFEKLDKSLELIQEAREGFETRKAAVLEKAFRGELTEQWRKNNNVEFNYDNMLLKKLLLPMTNKKPNKEENYFRYIDIDSIDNTKQVVSEPKKVETSKSPSRASREVREGDIVFSTVRPYLKNIAYITKDLEDCIASTGFYICRARDYITPKFLFNLLCSENVINYYTSLMKGDNSPAIRKGEFESLEVNVPPVEEQNEIVRILDKLLEEEDRVEELTQLEEQIGLIKKSILAKAFRGELGTNRDEDESSIELLKNILSK